MIGIFQYSGLNNFTKRLREMRRASVIPVETTWKNSLLRQVSFYMASFNDLLKFKQLSSFVSQWVRDNTDVIDLERQSISITTLVKRRSLGDPAVLYPKLRAIIGGKLLIHEGEHILLPYLTHFARADISFVNIREHIEQSKAIKTLSEKSNTTIDNYLNFLKTSFFRIEFPENININIRKIFVDSGYLHSNSFATTIDLSSFFPYKGRPYGCLYFFPNLELNIGSLLINGKYTIMDSIFPELFNRRQFYDNEEVLNTSIIVPILMCYILEHKLIIWDDQSYRHLVKEEYKDQIIYFPLVRIEDLEPIFGSGIFKTINDHLTSVSEDPYDLDYLLSFNQLGYIPVEVILQLFETMQVFEAIVQESLTKLKREYIRISDLEKSYNLRNIYVGFKEVYILTNSPDDRYYTIAGNNGFYTAEDSFNNIFITHSALQQPLWFKSTIDLEEE